MKTEAWLRGPMPGVSPFLAPTLATLRQAREELAEALEGLTGEQIWSRPFGATPLGYHVRHIAGSTDRLTTYLEGKALGEEQLAQMRAEGEPMEGLLEAVEAAFRRAEAVIQVLDVERLTEFRGVGRMQLPTTVIGLVVHIAEHTLRHVGQAVVTAKLLKTKTQPVQK